MIRFKHALVPAAACLLLCAAALPAGAQTYTTTRTVTTYTTTPLIVDDGVIVNENSGIMSLDAATSRALRAEPGRVERSGLTVNGLGEPVYVFDIRQGDQSHIVGIDAVTGQVLGRHFMNPRSRVFERVFPSD